jgi:hypothetical protein
MVLRIAGCALVMVCALFILNVAAVHAAYPGPVPGGMPPAAPGYGPSTVVPVGPGFVMSGPSMAMPRSMSCAPACPPPCPPPCAPPMCEPPCATSFNPLSAVWGMVAMPFKVIGGLFGTKQACNEMPMCAPSCCTPMLPPTCGPVCAPITKVKAQRRMPARAASHNTPMPMAAPRMQ